MKNSLRAAGALMLTLSLCGGLLNVAQAAPVKAPAKAPAKSATAKGAAKPGDKNKGLQRMFAAVGVTPDQKKKIVPILRSQRDAVKAIKADGKLTDDAKKAKIKALRKANDTKMQAMLTADQKKKLAAFKKQRAAENKAKAAKKKA